MPTCQTPEVGPVRVVVRGTKINFLSEHSPLRNCPAPPKTSSEPQAQSVTQALLHRLANKVNSFPSVLWIKS